MMDKFLPDTASLSRQAKIYHMRDDGTTLWATWFSPAQPIPFYSGIDPLPGPYTVHVEWAEKYEVAK